MDRDRLLLAMKMCFLAIEDRMRRPEIPVTLPDLAWAYGRWLDVTPGEVDEALATIAGMVAAARADAERAA